MTAETKIVEAEYLVLLRLQTENKIVSVTYFGPYTWYFLTLHMVTCTRVYVVTHAHNEDIS